MRRRSFLASPAAAWAANALFERIDTELAKIEAVDTHEHILPEARRTSEPMDFFKLASHYALDDVTSAGLPQEARALIERDDTPAVKKWELFEPWWRYARYTGYGQALRIAMRDVYGVEEISAKTLPRLNAAIADANRPGLYRKVLKDRARIRFAVNDEYWNSKPNPVAPEFFVLAKKFDWFVTPITRKGVANLEPLSGTSITTLGGLKKALEKNFADNLALGMVTVKTTLAYNRELLFHEVSEADAERDFERLMRDEERAPEGFRVMFDRPYRKLADHMFHHLVKLADAHDIPFQIHTGLQAGNGNVLTNSRPDHLQNLFFLYPRVRFDLFHIGYPWQGEVAVYAKTFPNVYADFCWMHIVSPTEARSALHTMLDTVPVNKIFGFGGDYRYPELSYAHLVMARRNIAQVLRERVESELVSENEAGEIGRLLLADNGARIFSRKSRT